MSENTLLFELLCEELPPSSQKQMSDFLATEIFNQLNKNKFTTSNSKLNIYSTPRRIGFKISHTATKSPAVQTGETKKRNAPEKKPVISE